MTLRTTEGKLGKEYTWTPEYYKDLECMICQSHEFMIYVREDDTFCFMCCNCEMIYYTHIKAKN